MSDPVTQTSRTVPDTRPNDELEITQAHVNDGEDELEKPGNDAHSKQEGVAEVEAITSVWSKRSMWFAFVVLYIITLVDMIVQATQTQLVPYVTSSFSKHALLSTTSVMSTIMGGVAKLSIAKIVNIWGRLPGFIATLGLMILGLILKAACRNVETYAAAQTLYWTGHLGLKYLISVYYADMTSLKNRMIAFGIDATPPLVSTFAGPALAEAFYKTIGWRWAFGIFTIFTILFAIPVIMVFGVNAHKAKKAGLIRPKSGRTLQQSIKYYLREFDVIGLLLTTAGFALILLPLSLASSSASKWKSGSIIAMIVVGFASLIAFAIWERYFAPVQYLPFHYLKDRTILGACMAYFVLFLSVFCWDVYFSSYLQVVNGQSISNAGYILNTYFLSLAAFSPFVGYLIRRYGRVKLIGLASIPFAILGTALLIYFRHPGTSVGYLVMCQIFSGLSGAIVSLCSQMAVMSAVSHNEVAVVLAIHGLFGSIGQSIGLSVSGAIWTNTLPGDLKKYLPEAQKANATAIYGSLTKQLAFPMGSPARDGIIQAYGDVQRKLAIAGAAVIPLMLAAIISWRNLNVKKMEQNRGNVW